MSSSLRLLSPALLALLVAGVTRAQEPLLTVLGTEPDERFADLVVGLGDVDGDGRGDFAAGTWLPFFTMMGSGTVTIHAGRNGAILHTIESTSQQDSFGYALASTGDVDQDGVPDVLVGAPAAGQAFLREGQAVVCSGATGEVVLTIDGAVGDALGAAVAGPGDVNGDGVPDLLIGAPFADVGVLNQAGSARLHSGADGALLHAFVGNDGSDRLGLAVAGAGDVDGDGVPDLMAATEREDGVFAPDLFVYSGATFAVLHLFEDIVESFDGSLAGAGDVDGDGFGDLLVGDSDDEQAGPGTGRARLLSGADGSTLFAWSGEEGDHLGRAVCSAGDVDGDGRPDVAIGAPIGSIFSEVRAYVQVRSGATGALLHRLEADAALTEFGASLSDAGDVNGDGRPDLLVGEPRHLDFLGTARLYSANDTGMPPAAWVDLGGGTAGVGGVPQLVLDGPLVPGSTVTLDLTGGPPSAFALLFVSVVSQPAPFLGGTLHALPLGTLVAVATDGLGELHASAKLGALPPGQDFWFQLGLLDPTVPVFGASLSNAMRGTAP